jgi:hypothetical protein
MMAFIVNQILRAAEMNALQASIPPPTQVGVFAVGSALQGSPPAPSAGGFLLQGGVVHSFVLTAGQALFTFPTAFPNGLLTFVLTNFPPSPGDPNSDIVIGIAGVPNTTNVDIYGWNIHTDTGAGSINFTWLAIGF